MTLEPAPVAHPPTRENVEGQGTPSPEPSTTILSPNERLASIDIVKEFGILLSNGERIKKNSVTYRLRILSQLKRIFSSEKLGEIFLYLVDKKAFSAWDIQVHLDIPEQSAYRHLKTLRAMGIITKALRATKDVRPGIKPTIWQAQCAEADDIVNALNRHYRSLSPKYRVAEKLAQTLLTEIIEKDKQPELKYHEIVQRIREKNLHRELTDIADLTAQYLHEQGIKVWR